MQKHLWRGVRNWFSGFDEPKQYEVVCLEGQDIGYWEVPREYTQERVVTYYIYHKEPNGILIQRLDTTPEPTGFHYSDMYEYTDFTEAARCGFAGILYNMTVTNHTYLPLVNEWRRRWLAS